MIGIGMIGWKMKKFYSSLIGWCAVVMEGFCELLMDWAVFFFLEMGRVACLLTVAECTH